MSPLRSDVYTCADSPSSVRAALVAMQHGVPADGMTRWAGCVLQEAAVS